MAPPEAIGRKALAGNDDGNDDEMAGLVEATIPAAASTSGRRLLKKPALDTTDGQAKAAP